MTSWLRHTCAILVTRRSSARPWPRRSPCGCLSKSNFCCMRSSRLKACLKFVCHLVFLIALTFAASALGFAARASANVLVWAIPSCAGLAGKNVIMSETERPNHVRYRNALGSFFEFVVFVCSTRTCSFAHTKNNK